MPDPTRPNFNAPISLAMDYTQQSNGKFYEPYHKSEILECLEQINEKLDMLIQNEQSNYIIKPNRDEILLYAKRR